ncbi:unnamed protein product [Prunus armeniaca]
MSFVFDANPDMMMALDLNSGQNLNSGMDTMGISGVQSVIDGASFRDKLMNKVATEMEFERRLETSGFGQYLVLQKWRPGFCPATAHITRMAEWIRVSAIHLECFDVWELKRISNLLGKLLKTNALTISHNRGKFAKMCVELDLTKPLEAFVQINQEWYNIEYEGLPDVCYLCGRYGHKREHCEKRNSIPAAVPSEDLLENLRGPWMNVPARRRPKAMHKDQGGRNNGLRAKGSRFDALHDVSEKFGQEELIGNGADGQSVYGKGEPSTRDAGLGKKVWTKSKAVKPDVRVPLNDISNKPQQDKKYLAAAGRKEGGAKSTGFGNLIAIAKMVIGGKRVESSLPLLDKIANWVSSKDVKSGKGIYIFGHQPPNIVNSESVQEDGDGINSDANSIGSSYHESVPEDEGAPVHVVMDTSEGQVRSSNGKLLDNTFTNTEGLMAKKAMDIVQSLGFSCFEVVDPVGFLGGLWLLWHGDRVKVEVLGTMDQAITACVSWPGQVPWMLTVVYAKPCNCKREKLWDYLTFVASCHKMPWLLARDFNEMFQVEDKLGGGQSCIFKGFRRWFSSNEMVYLGFYGPKFTWTNGRVFERLDRAEALFWQQKSRIQWLQEGDRNTKFFHMTIVIRRRRNKIERLKNEEGFWVEDAAQMKGLAVNYFSNLFSQSNFLPTDITIPNLFPGVNSLVLNGLLRPVTVEEIKTSLFNIGSLKAPRVDGFLASFFQFNWDICAPDIVDMVLKVFQDCLIPKDLNYTLITLVPKVENPSSMLQFMPINLCCTLYKIISKIIVSRLRPLMSQWISPNQVSFVLGRHITDNILIAQEMMYKFRVSKGEKGLFAWKINLSKAYDRLNWKFIEYVIEELQLSAHYIKLIISCVNSVRYQVCVNGELTEPFLPSNGIRQKASIKQARVMNSCLDLFCQASGQSVNFDKSAIFYSPNTNMGLAREISGICGSPLTNNLGRYLGMPMLDSRVMKGTFMGIVDKMHKRLASWKSNLLSFAGQTTLIQAVMSAMHVYAMQTAKLPMSTYEEPKNKGGLGLKSSANLDQALLAKIGWRIHNNDQGLWVKMFEDKYLKGQSILKPSLLCKKDGSSTWKGIMYGAQLLRQGMSWRLGRGDNALFWKDHWLHEGPLLHQKGVLNAVEQDCTVGSFFKNRWWDNDKLRGVVTKEIVQKIINFPIGVGSNLQDTQIWSVTSDGMFSVKFAYGILFRNFGRSDPGLDILWKLRVPPKLKFFFWLVLKGRILTNEQRARRQLTSDPSCNFCDGFSESIVHLFRDFPRANEVWKVVGLPSKVSALSHVDVKPWLIGNLGAKAFWRGQKELPNCPQKIIQFAVNDWLHSINCVKGNFTKIQVELAWVHLGIGAFKLNMDGTCKPCFGAIGVRGVICDSMGDWVGAHGISNLVIEMDSALVVHLMKNPDTIGGHPIAGVCWFDSVPLWA